MGDKGKKDKQKHLKQKQIKHTLAVTTALAKQPKKVLEKNSPASLGGRTIY